MTCNSYPVIHPKKSAASLWFQASEAMGDFMGIRYGRMAAGAQKVDWLFVSHCDCDGIGGFARLLRERGAEISSLPQTASPCRGVIGPLWNLWRACRQDQGCARRDDWKRVEAPGSGPSKALAWHVFTEEETRRIRETGRLQGVTVNSHLWK